MKPETQTKRARLPKGYAHGQAKSHAFCDCDACSTAEQERVARRERRVRKTRNQRGPRDLVDAAPAIARLREYTQKLNYPQTAELVGLERRKIWELLNRKEAGTIFRRTEELILGGPDPATVSRDDRVPVETVRTMVYRLVALGYPLSWQAMQIGKGGGESGIVFLKTAYNGRTVTVETYAGVKKLYDHLAYFSADVNQAAGLGKREIFKAKATARARGYFPPACYDEDDTLVRSAIRNERRLEAEAKRARRAEDRLTVIRLSLQGYGTPKISDLYGIAARVVERYRSEAGLSFENGEANCSLPRRESAARARYVRDAIAWYDTMITDVDLEDFLHTLGMMRFGREDRAALLVDTPGGWRYVVDVCKEWSSEEILQEIAGKLDVGEADELSLRMPEGEPYDGMVVSVTPAWAAAGMERQAVAA